ncbi:MAG: hypothetical protein Q9181_004549 [Wetmoreana brouardii]
MDSSQCQLLRLPLELRRQIYHIYFDLTPAPGLVRVNKSLYFDTIDFVRKRQQTFTYNITAENAGLDDFSLWCFKIKRHSPRLGRIKHLVLNIYPPDLQRPHEMWQIWDHVRRFSKNLGAQRRIPRLTVNFMKTTEATWMTNGTANATMDVGFKKDCFDYYNIEQVSKMTLYRFINNVDKPRLVLPPSYLDIYHDGATGQAWIDSAEQLITGQWTDDRVEDEYSLLEDRMNINFFLAEHATGRKCKAMFEKMFGWKAYFDHEDYERFKRDWPFMDTLPDWERPRCRWACQGKWCPCGGTFVEIEMPDPAGRDPENYSRMWDRAEKWQKETVQEEEDLFHSLTNRKRYPPR